MNETFNGLLMTGAGLFIWSLLIFFAKEHPDFFTDPLMFFYAYGLGAALIIFGGVCLILPTPEEMCGDSKNAN